MLDSIREIFDILDIDLEAVRFSWIKYNNEKDLIDAIKNQKCPVVDVLKLLGSKNTIPLTQMDHMQWLQLE